MEKPSRIFPKDNSLYFRVNQQDFPECRWTESNKIYNERMTEERFSGEVRFLCARYPKKNIHVYIHFKELLFREIARGD